VLALRADHAQVVRGVRAPLGDCAAVEVRGIEVVLCSVRDQAYEPGLFAGLGIDCAARRFIVVKSAQQYHLGFDAVTAVSLPLRSADRTARSYTRLNRPMWPLDEEFELP
jgi:microcystin degradation protein MlrC